MTMLSLDGVLSATDCFPSASEKEESAEQSMPDSNGVSAEEGGVEESMIDSNGVAVEVEGSPLLSPEHEREIILELSRTAEANLKDGNLYYLISHRWWRDWQDCVGLNGLAEHFTNTIPSNDGLLHRGFRPGCIDNSELVLDLADTDGELELRAHLQERVDYSLVPEDVWKKLLEWYGGGPELPRKLCISESYCTKEFMVELYPLRLQLFDARDCSKRIISISKKASVGELYNMVCTPLELEQAKVRIWDYFNQKKSGLLDSLEKTIEEANITTDQDILLEVQVNGNWPFGWFDMDSTGNELALVNAEPSGSSYSTGGGPNTSNDYSTGFGTNFLHINGFSSPWDSEDTGDILSNDIKVDGRGLAGLHNLGNTCFMNSAIQCLAHTRPLVEFFLQDYSKEINRQNPLGMQGELALTFGYLLRKLWLSGRTPMRPHLFKAKLGCFAPQFSGYNQHDSQELLAFLLDGLHEDLNRVKDKPYIEAKDSDDQSDEEFADECWQNHKARNDSIIVDICQGQYKSKLVCPVCGKVSVTFDPFMYLTLPLPSADTRTITITVFSGDGSALPMPYTVIVDKNGCHQDLCRALSIACCLNSSESLLLAEVYAHKIHRYLNSPSESLNTISDTDYIVAYKLPLRHEKLVRLEILHRRPEKYLQESCGRPFGAPLVTYLGAVSNTNIQAAVCTVLTPLLRSKVHSSDLSRASIDSQGCSSLDAIVPEDNGTCSSEDLSTSDRESEDIAVGIPSFKLTQTNDMGVSLGHLDNDIESHSESFIRVFLDWSDREHQLYDISFLEDLPAVFRPGFMATKTRKDAINLYSCLEAFLKEEPLGQDDMWYCPKCKDHRQATKKLELWRLPDILVVHLKRFSYNIFFKEKLDTFVNYPIRNLDLSKYISHRSLSPQSFMYDLYAVSNHYGGFGGGHYTAYAKLIDEDGWYDFDDSYVSSVSEDALKTSAAYVLFYRRVKDDAKMVEEEYST